jgi:Bbp16-like protein
MILDERNEFADATALNTGAPASFLVGDVIDLNVARDIGLGEPSMYFVVTVDTAVTSAGAATVAFSLCSDAQAAIAVDGTQTTHFKSADIAKATLIAGYVAVATRVPAEGSAYERFLGLVQTTGTAALTAGKVNAFLTFDIAKWKSYADGI